MSEHNEMMIAMRVLTHAINELNRNLASQKAADPKPINAGLPWSEEEDRLLMEAFAAGISPEELADHFERNIGGITSRLATLSDKKAESTAVNQARKTAAHLQEAIDYHRKQQADAQARQDADITPVRNIGDRI